MSKRDILIIDNSRVIVKLMTSLLEKEGHYVRSAEDAFEALDIVKHFTPDIIYLDLVMPKIGGDILCRILRTIPHLEQCYIVIISATLTEQILDFEKIGANGAIAKGPFGRMSEFILETVAESLERRQKKPLVKGAETVSPRHITQELLSQNTHLRKLLESMSQGVLELENNRVLYLNSAAENILKVGKEVLLGSYLNEILELELWNILGPKISTCKDSSHDEEENSPVELHEKQIIFQCLKFENNNAKRLVLLTDITFRKKIEAVAEAANLSDNLGYIFSGIRHEIGNPLNSIKIALTVLQKNIDSYDKETVNEFVGRSLEEVGRLEYLLKALKNYSLFEKPDVHNVEINFFLENFVPLIRDDLEKRNIEIRTRIEKDDLSALADVRALHHVLLNLVTNAADSLTDTEDPIITLTAERTKSHILIKVDDNGCGISDEDQVNLFKPFFTSKTQGTGLGLVIVKKMLSGMNSNIKIDSIFGFGTTITVSLPVGDL